MKIISHRGEHHLFTENGFLAFQKAIDFGANRIETDLQLSKDNHVIVMHDQNLKRTSGLDARISELTLEEIKGIKLHDGSEIPTLQEIISRFIYDVEFNFELKGSDDNKLAEAVAQVCVSLPNFEKVIFSSFNLNPLIYLKNNYPDFQRALLVGYDTMLKYPKKHNTPELLMKETNCQIIHPDVNLIDQDFMNLAKEQRWTVYTWASLQGPEDNKPEELWQKLYELNIDGHCTNYVEKFSQFVRNKALENK